MIGIVITKWVFFLAGILALGVGCWTLYAGRSADEKAGGAAPILVSVPLFIIAAGFWVAEHW